jgi:Nucleotidyltransferase domain
MNAARQASYFGEEEKHFLRALLYFDIFNYPLTSEEVVRFSPAIVNSSPHQSLASLVSQKLLFRFQNFYSLQDDQQLAIRRIKGNALANEKMKIAKRFSKLVSLFPFVRAVMLSGSISKSYMDENSDIDYFIVTEANRLWIVRIALAIFRRIFLFNSHRNLCTNYFIDNQNLEIRDKNIFTAIELCTTKPMFGRSTIEKFQKANEWAFSFLPNFRLENAETPAKEFFLKTTIEKISSFKSMDYFNEWLMNKSIAHWKRRYTEDVHPADFEIAFRSTTGISKSHPQFFQKKVLTLYDQKIKDFETKNGIDLSI